MSSDYSDDQYRADYESRYPDFSDYQVTDAMIAEHQWDRPAKSRGVHTYESKYQSEQAGIPTYIDCPCGKCTQSAWPRKPKMYAGTTDDRLEEMRRRQTCGMTAASIPAVATGAVAAPAVSSPGAVESMIGAHCMDPTTIMLVMMFIMFVFICYCMKSIIELKAQLKVQKSEK